MSILYILIPITLLLLIVGLTFFWWTLKDGQYDDLDSQANRILFIDDEDDEMVPEDVRARLKSQKDNKEQDD